MYRTVGPLLIGLGLCIASGCTLVGGPRGLNLAERGFWKREASKKTAGEADETSAIVSFRPPSRHEPPTASIPAESDFTGHVPRIVADQNTPDSPVVSAALETTQENAGDVRDAQFRSDRDSVANPVELQGLQLTEPDTDDLRVSAQGNSIPEESGFAENGIQLTTARSVAPPRGPWQSDLEQLIGRAERDLASFSPGTDPARRAEYRRQQVHLRLLYLIARHPEQALTSIPSLDAGDQEYWQQMIWAMTNSLDSDGLTDHERAVQTIPPVNTALRRLREQADLDIRNSAFCEEISYFGNYKRFPREEFVPGQLVLLYAEIENFRSEPTPSGEYRTLLRSLIEIVGPNGEIRWKKNFAATEDLCRNPRRDYFHNYQFTIPERLPLGPHSLKLTVVDELSGKQSTSILPFVVK